MNLNNPRKQLPNFNINFPDVDVICINELNVEPWVLDKRLGFESHFTAFYHEPVKVDGIDRVFAAILVRNDINIKVSIKYKKAPFISCYLKIPLKRKLSFGINVCCFYRFHYYSKKAQAMKLETRSQHNNYFVKAFEEVRAVQFKVTSLICGDLNMELKECRKNDPTNFIKSIKRILRDYTNQVNEPTFERNKISSQIDVFWTKIFSNEISNFTIRNGPEYLGTDGHNVLDFIIFKHKLTKEGSFTIQTHLIPDIKDVHAAGVDLYSELQEQISTALKETEELISVIDTQPNFVRPKITPIAELIQNRIEDLLENLMPLQDILVKNGSLETFYDQIL